MPNLTDIRRVAAAVIHADRRRDGHDEGNKRFGDCANAPKKMFSRVQQIKIKVR
jgi:hypothetical protein